DPVEPRPGRAAAFEPAQTAPGPQQGVLQRVFGIVDGPQHAVAVREQLGAVGLDKAAVGLLVAPASRLEQLSLLRRCACWGGGHAMTRLDRSCEGPPRRAALLQVRFGASSGFDVPGGTVPAPPLTGARVDSATRLAPCPR